jgi:hypothetical protein
VRQRVLNTAPGPFLFRVTSDARAFLLQEGTDLKYGARHLKRAIERNVVYPLANLLATEQVRLGDVICIDFDAEQGRLVFQKEGEGAVIPVPVLKGPKTGAAAAQATGGRPVEVAAPVAAREAQAPFANPPGTPLHAPTGRRKNNTDDRS